MTDPAETPRDEEQIRIDVPNEPVEHRPRPLQMANLLSQFPRISDRMALEFAALVRDVVANENGKAGSITLTLTVSKPNARLNLKGRELFVAADIKVKEPADAPNTHLFYHDEEGGLHMQDPYQRRMFTGPQGL